MMQEAILGVIAIGNNTLENGNTGGSQEQLVMT